MRRGLTVVLVGLALAVATSSAAQSKHMEGEVHLGWVDTLAAPHLRCVGGEPTGLPFPKCTDDTNRVIGKDEVQMWAPVPVDVPNVLAPMVDGSIKFVVNCTLNRQYRGPCWDTFEWETSSGTWEGSWVSPIMDLVTYDSVLRMVGHGKGGDIEGMQLKFDGASVPPDNWYIGGTVRVH